MVILKVSSRLGVNLDLIELIPKSSNNPFTLPYLCLLSFHLHKSSLFLQVEGVEEMQRIKESIG